MRLAVLSSLAQVLTWSCSSPAGMVYNSSGELGCFDLYGLYVQCADPTGCGRGSNSLAWDYQVLHPVNGSRGLSL